MINHSWFPYAILAMAAALPGSAAPDQNIGRIGLAVPLVPAPVTISGRAVLRYELRISSRRSEMVTVPQLDVVDARVPWFSR